MARGRFLGQRGLTAGLCLLGLLIALLALGARLALHRGLVGMPAPRPDPSIATRVDGALFANRQVDLRSLASAQEIVQVALGSAPADNPRVSLVLETARRIFGADIVYVQDRNGTVVSCTRYEGGASLTGHSYAFRPYFISALRGQPMVYPAMGVTTGQRGLYFSTPVAPEHRGIVGVLVVKASLDGIDAILAADPDPVFLVSPDGVVFASNRRDLLFHYVTPMPAAALERIRASQQFGDRELKPLPELLAGRSTVRMRGTAWSVTRWRILSDWTLLALARSGPAYVIHKNVVFTAVGIVGAMLVVIAVLASVIGARRKAEAELGLYREHLEEQVERRTAELREAKESAEAATEAKSTFLASMSHELRTPLNAILGYAQLLTRSIEAPEGRDNLQRIHRAGEHLLGLINHVLSLSKIEAGKLAPDPQPFACALLFKSIDDLVRIRAVAKGLEFRLEVRRPFPEALVGDALKLRQVLVNLLGNAVKFTRQGQVSLTIERTGGKVRFTVRDTGCGMDPGELGGLFQPFQQTRSGRAAAEGTGLGLHLSQAMVRVMGGVIEVESELGRGSVFHFEIPMAEDQAPPAEPARQLALAPGQRALRMLVVDDVEDNRTLLARMLTALGMEVRAAADGASALALWEAWRPHAMWLDLRMPVLDGEATALRLRAREAALGWPRTVVIAITASVLDRGLDPSRALPFDDLIGKPFPESELVDKLHRHCGLELARTGLPPPEPSEADLAARIQALDPAWSAPFERTLILGDRAEAQDLLEHLPDRVLAAAFAARLSEFDFEALRKLLACGRSHD